VRLGYDVEMQLTRRALLVAGAAGLTTGVAADAAQGDRMYGLIGKMTAVEGKRDDLVAILLDGVSGMPGCLSYVVATDPADASAIWITEAWDSKASHDASLALPSVKAAIAKGRPLIAAFGSGTVTTPVGGHGLAAAK
jgi:quinol monooxygenase YgiN